MRKFILKNQQGFSIIEFLITIAILGVLSTIVFVSYNSVGNKSDETIIKSNLGFIRSGASIYFNHYNNFGTTTFSATKSQNACSTANTIFDPAIKISVNQYILAAESESDSSSNWVATCALGKLSTETNATSWAVSVPLKNTNIVSGTSGTDYWCVDSSRNQKVTDLDSTLGGGATTKAVCY
jgi:prepilin-type N-terminal cleavage/methylation domain-containing protein